MSVGKSIRLYLADGTPGGLLTAEIMNWTGHVVAAPRSDLASLLKRPEAAGRKIERLHVRYRVAVAVSELAQSLNLQLNLVPGMENLISSYRKSADDRLIRRID